MAEKRMPKVGEYVRSVGTLLEIRRPDPTPPPPDDYVFEDNGWRVELRRRGKVLDTLGTYNDHYGLNTGRDAAIERATGFCKSEEIGPESELELVVVHERERRRMRPNDRKNYYAPHFFDFDSLRTGACYDVEQPEEVDVWSNRSAAGKRAD